jgi:hypothetical protein
MLSAASVSPQGEKCGNCQKEGERISGLDHEANRKNQWTRDGDPPAFTPA